MAKKQYTGAQASILLAAAGAVLVGSAWLGANQPAIATVPSSLDSNTALPTSAPSIPVTPVTSLSTAAATPAATATKAAQSVAKATKSRAS